jgi:hypothetical protein
VPDIASNHFDFCSNQISLPASLFLIILKFLPQHELSHSLALVSKTMLAATRSPTLWTRVDRRSRIRLEAYNPDYDYKSDIGNPPISWRKVLLRHQFSSLKSLHDLPNMKPRLIRGAMETINNRLLAKFARTCPRLEKINDHKRGMFTNGSWLVSRYNDG